MVPDCQESSLFLRASSTSSAWTREWPCSQRSFYMDRIVGGAGDFVLLFLSQVFGIKRCLFPTVYVLSHIRLFLTPWTGACKTLQARILEWVPVPFSRGSPRLRDRTRVCCISALAGNTVFPESSCFSIILETLDRKLSKAGCRSTGREHAVKAVGCLHLRTSARAPSSPKSPCGVPSLRKSVAERTPSLGASPTLSHLPPTPTSASS